MTIPVTTTAIDQGRTSGVLTAATAGRYNLALTGAGRWRPLKGGRLQEALRDPGTLEATARASFAEMGAEAFAQRATRELLATGETARKRTAETRDELTPHEARIARMARDGASNQDIATQLFVSRKTVEYHLHKVFSKLGISTRQQLE